MKLLHEQGKLSSFGLRSRRIEVEPKAKLKPHCSKLRVNSNCLISLKLKQIGNTRPGNTLTAYCFISTLFKISLMFLLFEKCQGSSSQSQSHLQCSRPHVKQARHIIQQILHPIFAKNERAISRKCLFHPERDMYHANAEHKIVESANRFSCGYCGKAFYEEKFLDQHFDARHPDTVYTGSEAVCLADMCDVLRCEVLQSSNRPGFWQKALCKDESLRDRRTKCREYLRTCIPPDLKGWQGDNFHRLMSDALCSKLSCEHYWDPIDPKDDSMTVVMYIFAAVFLTFTIIIYYFLVSIQEAEEKREESVYDVPDHAYLRGGGGARRRNVQ